MTTKSGSLPRGVVPSDGAFPRGGAGAGRPVGRRRARSHFADRVTVDFTSLTGGEPATIPADDLIAGWRTALHPDKISHRMRTNHWIAIDGDRAEVVSRGYAFNKHPRAVGDDLWEVWGVYRHTLVRTPDRWKVDGMAFGALHARGNEAVRTHVPESE